MRAICLFFQVHQPFRHRRYRFFDIGNEHYYYDDYANETFLRELAGKSYLPANRLFLKLAEKFGDQFKIAFSVTGSALEQFQLYAPQVIESFRELAKTGCVEFLSETYSHSLAALKDNTVFEQQVKLHEQKIVELFGQKPAIFRNTEMIYSDDIGEKVLEMGYKGMLTEGARHVLGWKSPNYLYVSAANPRLKVLMRNYKLSDDIAFRFSDKNWSEFPLTAEKFTGWLHRLNKNEEVINLFLSCESLGDRQTGENGIFNFIKSLAQNIVKDNKLKFSTPSQAMEEFQPVSGVSVPHPISWADEERDLTAWLGNEMQKEALEKLYKMASGMQRCHDPELINDWNYLQDSDHFYYMSTKYSSRGETKSYVSPFNSPYEAFINYMNVLNDFEIRLNASVSKTEPDQKLAALHKMIEEKDEKIQKMEAELARLKKIDSPASPKKNKRKK